MGSADFKDGAAARRHHLSMNLPPATPAGSQARLGPRLSPADARMRPADHGALNQPLQPPTSEVDNHAPTTLGHHGAAMPAGRNAGRDAGRDAGRTTRRPAKTTRRQPKYATSRQPRITLQRRPATAEPPPGKKPATQGGPTPELATPELATPELAMTPSLVLSEAPVTPSVPAPPELPAVSTRPVVPELPVPPPAPVSRAARSIPGSVIRPPRPRLPRSRLRPGMRRRSGYRSSRKPPNADAGRYCPSAKLASPARNEADQYLSRVDWCIRDLPDQAVLASQGFARLLDALRSGDSRALTIVIHQYSEWLRSAIRRAIHPRVRQRYDSVDFVQSTWASLILRRRRLPNIADADELARYLMRIAYHKVFDATRETLRTKKRDMRRECGLTDLEVGQTGRVAIRDRQQPRPSEVFRAREKLARMAKTLEEYPERMRDIHLRRVNGESLQQIAQTIGVHERTVRRILQRLLDESQRDP